MEERAGIFFKILFSSFFIFQFSCFNIYADSKRTSQAGRSFDEIVVTAQKSSENLQDIPISVTVFNEVMIDDINLNSVKEIAQYTPNFLLFSPGGFGVLSPSIRGMFSNPETISTSVGMYVDGVPVLNTIGYDLVLEDIERIEVLKGPQGTLYGKNAEAGVINVITKKPGNNFNAKISTEIGSDDKRQYSANLNLPVIKDKLSIGLSGRFYEKDGFLENIYLDKTENDRENRFGKVFLHYKPYDNLDISFISLKLKRDDGGTSLNMVAAEDSRETLSNADAFCKLETLSHALKISYKFGEFGFDSITSYKEEKDIRLTDMDFTSVTRNHGGFDSSYENITQELRLSLKKEKFDFLGGLYVDKGDYNIVHNSDYGSGIKLTEQDADDFSLGVFSHITYQINNKLSVSGGLRFDKDNRELDDHAKDVELENSYNEISPKIAAEYKVTPDIMTYATIAKGYKSGGFYMFAPKGLYKYEEETLWNYEIGLKSSFFENSLLLNLSAYYMDISDMQVHTAISDRQGYISNAASASSKGAEFEAQYRLTSELSFFLSAGYNSTKFDHFNDYKGDYKNNYSPFAPEYNYSLGGQYRSSFGYFARIDLTGYGKMYLDKANKYEKDAYSLVNGKFGYETENFDIYLYGKNIFDAEYDDEGYYGFVTYLSDPMEIGVQVNYRF